MAEKARHAAVYGNGVTVGLWIGVCAATPEAIWRGMRVVLHHVTWADAAGALMVGLILAFCVEPGMERLRHILFDRKHTVVQTTYSPLFAAAAGIAFALASVCLHDAMTAFIEANGGADEAPHIQLSSSLRIALAWAVVPFFITLAWVTAAARHRLAPIMGALAFLSPLAAAWFFAWPLSDSVTTFVACTLFLGLGYRTLPRGPLSQFFPRAARAIAISGPLWLLFALAVDQLLALTQLTHFRLYTTQEFWIDLRFYAGWCLGLLIAPFPLHTREGRRHGKGDHAGHAAG